MARHHALFDPLPGHALSVVVVAAAVGAWAVLLAARGPFPVDGSAARSPHRTARPVAVAPGGLSASATRADSGAELRHADFLANATSSAATVLAVGDLMFDRSVRSIMAARGEDYPFAGIGDAAGGFFRGDIVVGNLEGAIAPRRAPDKTIDFAFDRSVAALLKRVGFDAVSTANNHALDQGAKGYEETRAALAEAGVGGCGHQVRDDGAPWTVDVRGRSVAMLCFNITDHPLDARAAEAAVRAAKQVHDVVLVQAHWGREYVERPPLAIVDQGREFVGWGADAVIGHHPHVMQGMELWGGRPIFWSLGNFVFDQYWSRETQRGLAVGLAFGEKGIAAYLFPVVSEKSQPRLAGAEDAALLKAFAARSALPDDLKAQAETGIMRWTY